ncbi:MAG TPA: NAD(P)/FAD-dependent oxidoreductase [Caulobacteraceae bacterium]|nr:NAD(P)/FAD-dependent oxidoreductase [Caulobacteraceae bacterium]
MESLTTEDTRPAVDGAAASVGRTQHFDVLIVGAGISGVGSAYHMKTQCPDRSYVVLESQDSFGGTWLSHRFPGIRSDSDLYTFGYRFKPWVGPPIASAAAIRKYMGDVIEENGLAQHIRYGHKVQSAVWSSADNRWTITAQNADHQTERFTANFLWMCQGYYRHEEGYTPDWLGADSFKGVIAHPENWPKDLDYKDKRVVIIGSGATAATMAPAMASDAAHVTVLQRSPTYFIAAPNANEFHDQLKPLGLDDLLVHDLVRRKVVTDMDQITRRSFEEPEVLSRELLAGVEAFVGPETVARHFTPTYRPWRQRIAILPDGDMLQAIQAGTVSMVTDHIDRFVPEGIKLKSGDVIEADIIATATGFNLNVLGDIDFVIDGEPLAFHETITYRGMMFTGVPNMAWVFGYLRNSWTLRTELVADFVCRMLNHMTQKGASRVEVTLRPAEHNMPLGPWIDPENFNGGYIMRGQHLLPQRGDKPEWQHTQDYWTEKNDFPAIHLDDEVFRYA